MDILRPLVHSFSTDKVPNGHFFSGTSVILLISGIVAALGSFLLTAWILAVSARLLKSSRGRFSMGLLAMTTLAAINIGFAVLLSQLDLKPPASVIASLATIILELGLMLVLLKFLFCASNAARPWFVWHLYFVGGRAGGIGFVRAQTLRG